MFTDDLVEFLAVIKNESGQLSIGRLLNDALCLNHRLRQPSGKPISSSKTYRLHLSHLLQRAVHTLLKDLNLLIFLLAQLLKVVSALVKLLGLVLELNLFGLHIEAVSVEYQREMKRRPNAL